jgi:ankyrin repeat protein
MSGKKWIRHIRTNDLNWYKRQVKNDSIDINMDLTYDLTLLIVAIREKKFELIHFFLNNGADINKKTKRGDDALDWAVTGGDIEIIKLLVSSGADVKNSTCLRYVLYANGNNIEIFRYLLSVGASILNGNLIDDYRFKYLNDEQINVIEEFLALQPKEVQILFKSKRLEHLFM